MSEPLDDESPPIRSFVVKVWAEETASPRRDASWRGYVTHVGTGERLYLRNLVQVTSFIAPRLVEIGGRLDARTRLCTLLAPPSNEG
jgi:hypothetical protein